MKKTALLIVMPAIALMLAACGEGGNAPANAPPQVFAPDAQGGPNADFMRDMERRMKSLDESINGLDKRIGFAPEDAKGDLYKMSGELKIEFSNFKVELYDFLNNPEADEAARDKVEMSWQNVEHTFDEAARTVEERM